MSIFDDGVFLCRLRSFVSFDVMGLTGSSKSMTSSMSSSTSSANETGSCSAAVVVLRLIAGLDLTWRLAPSGVARAVRDDFGRAYATGAPRDSTGASVRKKYFKTVT